MQREADNLWPRISRVRQERPDQPIDREALFARVREAFAAARSGGSLSELERAVMTTAKAMSQTQQQAVTAAAAYTEMMRRQLEDDEGGAS
jgi:hypothetical protein